MTLGTILHLHSETKLKNSKLYFRIRILINKYKFTTSFLVLKCCTLLENDMFTFKKIILDVLYVMSLQLFLSI
jgi:hypothetical protein